MSREQAAFKLHIGSRTLTSYETGQTMVPPEVVLKMAEVYERPDLPANYCAMMCPIGQKIAYHFEKNNIATIALGLLKELEDVVNVRTRMVSIAADGRLAKNEIEDFRQILRELCELGKEIEEMRQFAAKNGISIEDIMPNQKEKAASQKAAS